VGVKVGEDGFGAMTEGVFAQDTVAAPLDQFGAHWGIGQAAFDYIGEFLYIAIVQNTLTRLKQVVQSIGPFGYQAAALRDDIETPCAQRASCLNTRYTQIYLRGTHHPNTRIIVDFPAIAFFGILFSQ